MSLEVSQSVNALGSTVIMGSALGLVKDEVLFSGRFLTVDGGERLELELIVFAFFGVNISSPMHGGLVPRM